MKSLTVGLAAGVLCTLSFLPQVVKVFKTRQTKDLSLVTFAVFAAGVLLWLIYGIMLGQLPIVLANAATLLMISLIVVMKIRYG